MSEYVIIVTAEQLTVEELGREAAEQCANFQMHDVAHRMGGKVVGDTSYIWSTDLIDDSAPYIIRTSADIQPRG